MHVKSIVALSFSLCSLASAQPANLEFENGVSGWRTVLDGVMGGRSTGRITQPETGILRFSGELSLENNGGFSRAQTNVPETLVTNTTGLEARIRGDGRTYQFDVRCSDVRGMASSFQAKFDTVAGEWTTVRLPFDQFRLYSFGRLVANPPKLNPPRIESIGITLSDKQPGPFQLDVDFVRLTRPDAAQSPTVRNLAAVAKDAELTTLLSLIEVSKLQLPATGRITIFAPTNKAFESLPADKVKFLTSEQGKQTLLAILANHILPVAVDSGSLLQRRGVIAASGQNLTVDSDALTIAGSKLEKTDIEFDRGIIHIVDRIMLPELRPAADVINEDPRLSVLSKAIAAAGLNRQLGSENEGPWTILAPSNEAFAALGDQAIEALLANPSQLATVLSAHVIPSRIRRSEMITQVSAQTLLSRQAISFSLVQGAITAGGANLVAADIEASNGVIHIINRVLVPAPSAATDAAPQARVSAATVAGLIELAIDRGVPIFNNNNPDGCAAIYEVTITALLMLSPGTMNDQTADRLRQALAEGEAEKDATKRAWIYRRAMDRVLQDVSVASPK